MNSSDDSLQLFVEHVTHIDCGVFDAEAGLRGATWLVDATLTGRRGDDGMLFDFGPAKRLLKAEIDALVDHRLLVPAHAPGLTIEGGRIDFTTVSGDRYRYAGPASATTVFDAATIEPRALALWLEARVGPKLPANVDSLKIDLRAEAIAGPVYDYTHGLAGHDGNCQRLAHGHRCRLAVTIDGAARPDIAQAWAAAWQGVFIGHRADLTTPAGAERLGFGYAAPQGEFALDIAAERCVVLEGPPTVENIADHIAGELAARHPGRMVEVRAYEGVGKGAIATRSHASRP
ncbi:MAG: 6-carboxytetrahydropterin synthase [Salinisphaera sp.]|uniref:6-carboxytetrahydropterin synthase n=1 Tax=Salinisphaera sp. TaxID=1914330 RepID=UPI003C7CC662